MEKRDQRCFGAVKFIEGPFGIYTVVYEMRVNGFVSQVVHYIHQGCGNISVVGSRKSVGCWAGL